jgi:hypothetical protein
MVQPSAVSTSVVRPRWSQALHLHCRRRHIPAAWPQTTDSTTVQPQVFAQRHIPSWQPARPERAGPHPLCPPRPPQYSPARRPPQLPHDDILITFPCYYPFTLIFVSQANPGQQWSVFSLRSLLSRLQARPARPARSLQSPHHPDRQSARASGGLTERFRLSVSARSLASGPE